jgi:hypothetical protein
MHEISLQQIFALILATVSRYVTSELPILSHTLRSMPDATIQWPSGPDFERCSALVVARHPRLEGASTSSNSRSRLLKTLTSKMLPTTILKILKEIFSEVEDWLTLVSCTYKDSLGPPSQSKKLPGVGGDLSSHVRSSPLS